MDKFGLIGYSISHSLSPALFTAAYNGKYRYELIDTPDFDEAWRIFDEGYRAVNVTAPFKILAARRADIIAPEVKTIGAANILVHRPEGIVAHNSDYLGVYGVLSDAAPSPRGMKALIVGFGGAGMAAAQAARDLGMEVTICNRSTDKAPGIRPLSELKALADATDVLVYNIPVGIEGLEKISAPIILEANYKIPYLKDARCSVYIPGTAWHLRQAVKGYELMSGEVPDTERMKTVYGR